MEEHIILLQQTSGLLSDVIFFYCRQPYIFRRQTLRLFDTIFLNIHIAQNKTTKLLKKLSKIKRIYKFISVALRPVKVSEAKNWLSQKFAVILWLLNNRSFWKHLCVSLHTLAPRNITFNLKSNAIMTSHWVGSYLYHFFYAMVLGNEVWMVFQPAGRFGILFQSIYFNIGGSDTSKWENISALGSCQS